MRDAIYAVLCTSYLVAKRLFGRRTEPTAVRFVDIGPEVIAEDRTVAFKGLPGAQLESTGGERVNLDQLFPVENAVPPRSNRHLKSSYKLKAVGRPEDVAKDFSIGHWRRFIDQAYIPVGYRNGGLKYAGYIASGRNSWCLPSWIWTNAAIVRYLCAVGDIEEAKTLGEKLLAKQEAEGGWVVRSDYNVTDVIPVLAPNDSAYIANNAFLELYKATNAERYLAAARRCADWIVRSARPDGLVWTGYNRTTGECLKERTIVDTGFTAGLFANLYLLTREDRYGEFLERFTARFVDLFYDPRTACFATNIDESNNRIGGRFARGQAWALEGLIPAYKALGSEYLKRTVQNNVMAIAHQQLPNGGWSYNFDRGFLGEDCKGVPVLAKALLDWHAVEPDERLTSAAERALTWCVTRTSRTGGSLGGIFSFSFEGAVVHSFNTSTAFVYSSAYALEAWRSLAHDE